MNDSRERAAVYRRVESIVLEDAPVVPLYHLANTFAVRTGVHGLAVTPLGAGNLALERVWIDAPVS
jgi:oligopeptide transport system substrate-binding protein